MLTELEKKEIELLKKDPDVKLAKRAEKQKQYLYQLRSLKRKGQKIREAMEGKNNA